MRKMIKTFWPSALLDICRGLNLTYVGVLDGTFRECEDDDKSRPIYSDDRNENWRYGNDVIGYKQITLRIPNYEMKLIVGQVNPGDLLPDGNLPKEHNYKVASPDLEEKVYRLHGWVHDCIVSFVLRRRIGDRVDDTIPVIINLDMETVEVDPAYVQQVDADAEIRRAEYQAKRDKSQWFEDHFREVYDYGKSLGICVQHGRNDYYIFSVGTMWSVQFHETSFEKAKALLNKGAEYIKAEGPNLLAQAKAQQEESEGRKKVQELKKAKKPIPKSLKKYL